MSVPADSRAPSTAATEDPLVVLKTFLQNRGVPTAAAEVVAFLEDCFDAWTRYRRRARGVPLDETAARALRDSVRVAVTTSPADARDAMTLVPDFEALDAALKDHDQQEELRLARERAEARRVQEERERAAKAAEDRALADRELELAREARAQAAANADDDASVGAGPGPAPSKDKGKKRKADDQSEADVDSTVRVDLSHLQGVQRARAERAYAFWRADPVCDRCANGFSEVRECVFVEPHDLKCDLCHSQQQGCYFGGSTFNGQHKLLRSGRGRKEKEEPLEVALTRPNKRPRLEDGNLGGGSLASFQGRVRELFGDFRSIPEAARTQAIALGTQARVRQAFEYTFT
ncbi:uncharacterized protein C8Q71DRAFT_725275 [Rhodofomes roseus]|uniref:Uncharacterized protein n=1 Tax=Rhodofomes roseus TaxID=34475 RepID=A0ABQ8K9S3_9APHY|nr:uncharacterized protein C8Q71DRAFT_725275 [Rhodofomes roseus]KAH9834053.1 hypothetical protein C8Q71DRAFT_725275 [Rhodofomes roseus]